jgi:LysR family transcriptional regulator, transcriptional activator of nhaA
VRQVTSGLNYHHLLYFWTVVREGGISKAAEKLRLSQPAISAQIKTLEAALGERLFQRQGRTLVLTDVGRVVDRYAMEIFAAGSELLETLKRRPSGRTVRLAVGVANAVPKLVVYRLLRPAVEGPEPLQITCTEDDPEQLLARLATHALDVVISDTPSPPHVRVKVFNHLLGESGTTFFAGKALARRLRGRFPRSLNGAPVLLPTVGTSVRRALEQWFDAEELHPVVAGEFEDPALLNTFGERGNAVFAAPTAIEAEVLRSRRVAVVGRTSVVRERYYVISAERRLKHAGVAAITSAARSEVFGFGVRPRV